MGKSGASLVLDSIRVAPLNRMRSIPYATRLLSELSGRDTPYIYVLGAAETLQAILVFDGVVTRDMVSRSDDYSGLSTEELKKEIDNLLSAIMVAQMNNLDNYSKVDSLRRKFRKRSKYAQTED